MEYSRDLKSVSELLQSLKGLNWTQEDDKQWREQKKWELTQLCEDDQKSVKIFLKAMCEASWMKRQSTTLRAQEMQTQFVDKQWIQWLTSYWSRNHKSRKYSSQN